MPQSGNKSSCLLSVFYHELLSKQRQDVFSGPNLGLLPMYRRRLSGILSYAIHRAPFSLH